MKLRDSFFGRNWFWKFAAAFCAIVFPAHAVEPDIRHDATVDAIRQVMPSVVNVGTESVIERNDPSDVFFQQFFGPNYRRPQELAYSLGSGVIIDEDGYVLTNLHVVRRARRIQIKLSQEAGGGEYEVQPIIGTTVTDVALLKIIPKKPGEKFKAIKFAKDDDLLLGETLIALGNPFGLGGSVSRGILSAKQRAAPKDERTPLNFANWLQTDAAINPGNSGGPLINLRGELVGLNVAVVAQAQGIGFAIPIKEVSEALADLFTPETDSRWLGAHISSALPLVVTAIEKNSPAEKAGLKAGDQILQVNGKTPKGFIEMNQWLRDNATQKFSFVVQRGAQRPTISAQLIPFKQVFQQRLGIDAQELNEELAGNLALAAGSGLVITAVEKGGPADEIKLGAGFVITQINGQRVPNLIDTVRILAAGKKGDVIKMELLVPQRRGNLVRYQRATGSLKSR